MNKTVQTMIAPRGSGLGVSPTEHPSFPGVIALPYKLTTGHAAGAFLAELPNRRLVGTRCPSCARVIVPAQDFCAPCGESLQELVEVSHTGTLSGFTETATGVLALVRLDGADTDMVHRILDATVEELSIGQRVAVRWAQEPAGGILDIAGFALEESSQADAGAAQALSDRADPVLELPYAIELHYKHAYGPYYGRLFDELATNRRIIGVRCPKCECVLVPPREYCDTCFVRTGEWVDVADTGTIKAFSIIHLEFVGQVREPPYVYAEIVLDGAATRLIHTIGGIEVEEATEKLYPGMPVRAVWRDGEPAGSLEDILYFEPLFEDR
ncbi:MAG: hypothetical protein JWN10_2856 [Solirubrobacterales bacterium]|nr:hypothetical protein [Solirubrobacterales bacterium]